MVTPSTEGFPYRNCVRSVCEKTKYLVQAQPSMAIAITNPANDMSREITMEKVVLRKAADIIKASVIEMSRNGILSAY